jgi:D-3-phosphoglycerate dehydrogenase
VILSPHILLVGPLRSHERLAQVIVDKIKAKILVKSKLKIGNGLRYWVSFKSKIPKLVLGMENRFKTDQYGFFWWKDKEGKEMLHTMVAFVADTNYFEPSEKQFMQTSEWMISSF